RIVRVVAYEVTNRTGNAQQETIRLITTILKPTEALAGLLAQTYHDRWEHEGSNDELKTHLRGPGRILRSQSPDMVRQEIYGYLLAHHAISALVCEAATAADLDPDRIKFLRTVRRPFPPEHLQALRQQVGRDITRRKHLQPIRRPRSYPRVVRRARHSSFRVKRPEDVGIRHAEAPIIALRGATSPTRDTPSASSERIVSATPNAPGASQRRRPTRTGHHCPSATHPTPSRPDTGRRTQQHNTHPLSETTTTRQQFRGQTPDRDAPRTCRSRP
ncbi:MAG: hypothetical protein JXA67_01555, partial [Micromonosporaceae bacterium]|nr:hypothetical protein [Micromonosporaceae bacterium]